MPITTKDSEGPAERHGLLADFELLPVQAHLRTFELLAARRDLLQITRRVPGRRLRAVALRRDVKQRCFHSMLALSQVDDELLQAPRLAIRALRARPELALLALEQQLRALELAELRLEQRRADFETALLLREAHAFRVELCSAALEFCLLGLDARFGARLCAPRFVALALPTALTRLARGKRDGLQRSRSRARLFFGARTSNAAVSATSSAARRSFATLASLSMRSRSRSVAASS